MSILAQVAYEAETEDDPKLILLPSASYVPIVGHALAVRGVKREVALHHVTAYYAFHVPPRLGGVGRLTWHEVRDSVEAFAAFVGESPDLWDEAARLFKISPRVEVPVHIRHLLPGERTLIHNVLTAYHHLLARS